MPQLLGSRHLIESHARHSVTPRPVDIRPSSYAAHPSIHTTAIVKSLRVRLVRASLDTVSRLLFGVQCLKVWTTSILYLPMSEVRASRCADTSTVLGLPCGDRELGLDLVLVCHSQQTREILKMASEAKVSHSDILKTAEHVPHRNLREVRVDDGPAYEELPDEHEHYSHRAPWLRAGVLGANDGLCSVASLMLGVGGGSESLHTLVLAGRDFDLPV